LDSNSGSITFSRHCTERLDAVQEPSHSYWVVAGRMYTLSVRASAAIAALAEGNGSMMTNMSSFFIASTISRPRVWLFGACPQ
jgi:hypothetical protein